MVKPIKKYYPEVNPLPQTEWVPPYFDPKTGQWVSGYWRRPKYRKGTVIGYR